MGQTIAIVSTVLTVGVGIGAMVFSSTSSIRDEVRDEVASIRDEVRGEIASIRREVRGLAGKLEDTHRSLASEIKATRLELGEEIKGLDARVRVVEQTVARIEGRLSAKHPATQGASLSDHAEDDADA